MRCRLFASALAWSLALGAPAHAARIYKCVDADGRPLYTSEKRDTVGKKCQVITREVTVVPASPGRQGSATHKNYAREQPSARAAARERQRQILEKELAKEQEQLEKAQAALADQESQRFGNERNYARVLERLKPYQDDVENHRKNIEALRRELANLYR